MVSLVSLRNIIWIESLFLKQKQWDYDHILSNNIFHTQIIFKNIKIYANIWAAAAAKSLQSCPTLCDPIDGSSLGFSVSGILQERILEWVAISFFNVWKWKVKLKSLGVLDFLQPHGLQPI